MAVPGYQELMLPILRLASDGKEHSIREAMDSLAVQLNIAESDQNALLPSGTQSQYYNRVSWAVTYLTKSLLLEKSGRGRFRITERGVGALKKNPSRIDNVFLEQFTEYRAFKTKKAEVRSVTESAQSSVLPTEVAITPDERLEAAYEELRATVADELLSRVRSTSPKGFERLVVRLLVAMGYGGGELDHAEVTGKSGDDGIDGVIREDRLGLDMIYVQAKKWEGPVGPGDIDKFVGSLMRKKALKGVFITSGAFTDGARRAGNEASVKVRLIDGIELAQLMIDSKVGVSDAETYVVRKVDTDFFDDLA